MASEMDNIKVEFKENKVCSRIAEITIAAPAVADAFAKANGTISYEIVCSVGKRVPRVFIKDGKIDGIHLGILDTIVN